MKNENPAHKIGETLSFRRRGKRGTYTADFWFQGKHQHRSLRTPLLETARRRAVQLAAQIERDGLPQVQRPLQISDAVQKYLAGKRLMNLSPKTMAKYTAVLRHFTEYAEQQGVHTVQKLTADTFEAWRLQRRTNHAPKTDATDSTVVKGFTKWLVDRDILAKNPLRSCKVARITGSQKYCPSKEIVDGIIAQASADGDHALACRVGLAAFASLRSGEIAHLRPQDIDLGNGWIHISSRSQWKSKTGNSRKIPIHPRLDALLRVYIAATKKPKNFWFERDNGSPMNLRCLLSRFQKTAVLLGYPVGHKAEGLVFHSLRHFFETYSVNSDIPQRAVDAWMGHASDRSMGAIYYTLKDKESREFMDKVPF